MVLQSSIETRTGSGPVSNIELVVPRNSAIADNIPSNVNSLNIPNDNQDAEHITSNVEPPRLRYSHGAHSHIGSNDILSNYGGENDEDQVDGNENAFALKKTLVQGMMDVALITANGNQLRYVMEFNYNSKTYHVVCAMIISSILLQVIVGIRLIWVGKRGHHDHDLDHSLDPNGDIWNKFVLIAVFFITIINIFIATFPISAGPNPQI